MKVFLLRHASREFSFGDVALSNKGLVESQELVAQLSNKDISNIYSSPKLRAQQTVTPLSQAIGLPITTRASLNQQMETESSSDFGLRALKEFNNIIQMTDPRHAPLVCSHSDWLQILVHQILNLQNQPELVGYSLFPCAGWLCLDNSAGHWVPVESCFKN